MAAHTEASLTPNPWLSLQAVTVTSSDTRTQGTEAEAVQNSTGAGCPPDARGGGSYRRGGTGLPRGGGSLTVVSETLPRVAPSLFFFFFFVELTPLFCLVLGSHHLRQPRGCAKSKLRVMYSCLECVCIMPTCSKGSP